MRSSILAVAFAVALCLALPAQATVWTFNNIPIDGLQEVPPVATPGTVTPMATIDDVTGAISISGSFASLIAPATASHLHCFAAPGVNAPVLLPLSVTAS